MLHPVIVPLVKSPEVHVLNLFSWVATSLGPAGSLLHWEAATPHTEYAGNHVVIPYGVAFEPPCTAGIINSATLDWGFDFGAGTAAGAVSAPNFTFMYTVTIPDMALMPPGVAHRLFGDFLYVEHVNGTGYIRLSDGVNTATKQYTWEPYEELCIVGQGLNGALRVGVVIK